MTRSCLIALGLAACAGSATAGCLTPKQAEPLGEAIRLYHEGIRWGRYEASAIRLPATRRDDFLDERDRLAEDLRINGYEIIRIRQDKSANQARVHVKYTWYLDSRGVVHDTHTVQSWERQGRIWVLVGERHLRGEAMPGVDDAAKDATADDGDGDDGDGGRDDAADGDGDRAKAFEDANSGAGEGDLDGPPPP